MSYRTLPCWVALGVVGLACAGAQAIAADSGSADSASADSGFTTIILTADVAKPAAEVWKKIGGFCDIGNFMKMKCAYASGDGGLGTVRTLNGRIKEVMVGQTSHSYTYTQDPVLKDMYHATLDVESAGPGKSKIFYRIVYNPSGLLPNQTPEKYHDQHVRMFSGPLAKMKAAAEGTEGAG